MSKVCNFCNSKFTREWSLKRHQTSDKTCLEIQGKTLETIYRCESCEYTSPYKHNVK